jgi:hypothetical protein
LIYVAIAALRLAQSKEINLKKIVGAADHLNYFHSMITTESESYLIVLSDKATELSCPASAKLERSLCSFCLPPLPWSYGGNHSVSLFSCCVYQSTHLVQNYMAF